MNDIFYVYVYLNTLKPGRFIYDKDLSFEYEPFYVGKGKKDRYTHHLKLNKNDTNKHKVNTIQLILNENISPIIIKYDNLTEDNAFDKEKHLIRIIGRKDLNLGPLSNMTNGGDGPSNRTPWNKGKKLSIETKKKISNTLKKTSNWVTNNPSKTKEHKEMMSKLMTNRVFSKESKKKMSESSKGKIVSLETKKKISNSMKLKLFHNTDDFKLKISKANKGKIRSPEDKLKISLGRVKDKYNYISGIIFVRENINMTKSNLIANTNLNSWTITKIKNGLSNLSIIDLSILYKYKKYHK